MSYNYLQKAASLFYLPILGWLLCSCCPSPLLAQDGIMHHLDSEDGLPGLIVYRGIQSKAGYMWFATDKGLCRYDGEGFKTYYSNNLPDSEIIAVWEYDDKIWFINLLFQLFYLDNEVIKRFNPDEMLTEVRIHDFFVDNKNRYWLSGENILHKLEKNKKGQFIKEKYTFKAGIKKVFPFKSGEIGVVASKLYLFFENQNLFNPMGKMHEIRKIEYQKSLSTDLINSSNYSPFLIHKNQLELPLEKYKNLNLKTSGNLLMADSVYWFASDKGVFKISKSFKLLGKYNKKVNNNRVNNIIRDRNGNIWFCTNGEGIFILQDESIQNYTAKNSELPSSFVYKISGDEQGHIFIATKNGWLSEFSKDKFRNYKITNSNADFYDLQIEEKEVSYLCNGIFSIPKNNLGKLDKPKKIHPFSPKAMTRFKNDFWFATHLGIFKRNEELYEKISPFRSYAMHKGYSNTMWIGTIKGLYRYDYTVPSQTIEIKSNNNQRFSEIDSTNSTRINLIYKFDKNIQVTSNTPILKYNKYETPPFQKFVSTSNKMINEGISNILQTTDSLLWVLTKTNGLYVIDTDENLKAINVENGLISNKGNCLFVDELNNVWVGTGNGVSVFNNKLELVNNFTTANGLLSNNVTSIYKKGNKILIGTNKGLSAFDEDKLKPIVVGDIIFQKIQIQNRDTTIQQQYKLKHNQNNIFIDFVSISFNERLRYKYLLEGRNNQWIETEESFVRFSDLSPGSYAFKVKAVSSNKTESKISTIQFEISPPPWKTGWFYLFCTLLFVFLLTSFMRFWSNHIQEKANKKLGLERRFAQLELEALQSQMNPHFIFNVLNSIQNFILREDKVEASNYLSKFARLMRLFLDSSRSKYINLKDELKLLELYVELERLRFQNKFDFKIILEDNLHLDIDLPSMLLQPFFENAILHGLAHKKGRGQLNLKISSTKNGVTYLIEDDGVGREKAFMLKNKTLKKYNSYGMKIVKDRLNVLNIVDNFKVTVKITDLYPNSLGDKGTQIKIFVPIDK